MKTAMITVEVLISLLILFLVIATSTVTIKELYKVNQQQFNHEALYSAVLNIKDYIDDDICRTKFSQKGSFNGFDFEAKCDKIKELRNYKKAFDSTEQEGNVGDFLVQLYKVTLTLKNKKMEKAYQYQKTVVKRLF